ncbi:ATP-binding cassette domain-containing protein [Coraliomargarita sp. SDUM461003]|uniref:ATP-binding cassette domain-containing protein n=1 Tax=Thalassobacterium maritimum TaxID=3041265 RepID=A0ABU1AZ10_9BACT|nr:ATP-binding cassette domain-containing protein [Coraliomargarita sp. SDUM461003]MDQ8209400.1 ATP-binding cassette domain-containing protein [Coraliomargarita sp. SDUM461003]
MKQPMRRPGRGVSRPPIRKGAAPAATAEATVGNHAASEEAWYEALPTRLQRTPRKLNGLSPVESCPKRNQPIVLLVIEGKLALEAELFCEGYYEQRRRLATLEAGEILLIPQSPLDMLALYVGGDRSVSILQFDLAELVGLATENQDASPLQEALLKALAAPNRWEPRKVPPAEGRVHRVAAGTIQRVRRGQSLAPADKPVLVALDDGFEPSPAPESPLPETLSHWLLEESAPLLYRGEKAVQSAPADLSTFLADARATASLTAFIDFRWRELSARWEARRIALEESAAQTSSRRDIELQLNQSRLAGLLSGRDDGLPQTENHPLRAAFYLIRKQDWLPVLPRFIDSHDPLVLFDQIAASSGLLVREVRLDSGWWREDLGRILAFDPDGQVWVLLPRGKYYDVWDSRTGKIRRLPPKEAATWKPRAVTFYRQYPAKALGLLDIVLFELHQVRSAIAGLLALALLTSGVAALIPMAAAFIVQNILPGGLKPLLATVCGALLAAGGFTVAFAWAQRMLLQRMDFQLNLAATVALWHRILYWKLPDQRKYSAGDLAMRIGSFTGLASFFRMVAQSGATQSLTLISSMAVIFWVSFQLGFYTLLFASVALLVAALFSWLQVRAFMGGEKSLGIVNAFSLEAYSAIHKIKAAGVERSIQMQWAERFSRLRQKLIASQRVGIASSAFQTSWVTLSSAAFYFILVSQLQGDLSIAKYIAFTGAYATVAANLSRLAGLILGIGMQLSFLKFVEPLMKTLPDLRADRLQPQQLSGCLRAENLVFSYPGSPAPALNGLSFEARPGQFTVVVGPSGCGKSTLARVLAGLESARAGRVYLDDYDVETIDPSALRSNVAIVLQDFQLIPGTVLDNLRGALSADLNEVINAAKLACIWDDIEQMPMGVHTPVTGNASAFSGGQIQRMALARALLRRPRVLILDEVTSALDSELQAQIVANISASNQTVIFIAHRLSLAKLADKIVVLKDGKVVEQGSDAELRGKGGLYTQMTEVRG